MNETYNIEKTILASMLHSEIDVEVNKNYFTTLFHQKLVIGINRLKELQLCVDFELLRNSYIKANNWSYDEDNMLVHIMTEVSPFGSTQAVTDYISMLKESYKSNLDRKYAI